MTSDKLSKILFYKVELWIVLLLIISGLILCVLFGWIIKNSLSNPSDMDSFHSLAVKIASLPDYTLQLVESGVEFSGGKLIQRNIQIIKFDGPVGLDKIDQSFNETGMLLVSAYSDTHGISTAYLYDLKKQKRLWEWVPDYDEIVEMTPSLKMEKDAGNSSQAEINRAYFLTQHPYLVDDGSILFTAGEGILARIDVDSKTLWTSDRHYHHSIERMHDGNFIVPVVIEQSEYDFRDDGYAIVTPEGEIIEERSVAGILLRNGYRGLLFGVGIFESDRTHVNDAQPILEDDEYVHRGDIAISIRHLSTVFLYRPSEDRVIWLQTGPWINQHDIDYLGNGKFSIFGNDFVRDRGWIDYGNSNVYTYNMSDGKIDKPYNKVFKQFNIQTPTQGLQRFLNDGDIFVSMTDAHHLLRLNSDHIRWTYSSPLKTAGSIGALHWSRYFHREELNLEWLDRSGKN